MDIYGLWTCVPGYTQSDIDISLIPRILDQLFGCLGTRRKVLVSNVNNSVTLHYHTPFEVENVRYFVCVYVCEEK